MQHFKKSELDSIPADSRVMVVSKVGESKLRKPDSKQLTMLKTYALSNVRRESGAAPTDRTASTTLDEIDLANMGYIKCGFEAADVDKLTLKAIRANMLEFSRCAWGKALRMRFIAKAKKIIT